MSKGITISLERLQALASATVHPTPVPITMEMIKVLREETGDGWLKCKAALKISNGDFRGAKRALICGEAD